MMKQQFNKVWVLAILFAVLVMSSCQRDEEPDVTTDQGGVSFGFVVNNESLKQEVGGFQLQGKTNINPVAAIVSLSDGQGNSVVKNKRLSIQKDGEDYLSAALEVEPGNYQLSNYTLVDENNLVIATMPKTNVIELDVEISKASVVMPEVVSTQVKPVSTNGLKAGFGFVTLVVDQTELRGVKLSLDDEIGWTNDDEVKSNVFISWGDASLPQLAVVGMFNDGGVWDHEKHNAYDYSVGGKYTITIFGEVTNLTYLWTLWHSNVEQVDLLAATNLRGLNFMGVNGFSSIDVSSLKELRRLYMDNSAVSAVDLSNNTKLEVLHMGGDARVEVKDLDLSNNVLLKELDVSRCKLTNLDLKNLKELERVICSFNGLAEINVSKNPKLKILSCGHNLIGNIDISKNIDLSRIDIRGLGNLESLDISNQNNLQYINLDGTSVRDIDISNNKKLSSISWRPKGVKETDIDKFYMQLYMHANLNGIKGDILFPELESTSPLTMQLKSQLINTYGWTIRQDNNVNPL